MNNKVEIKPDEEIMYNEISIIILKECYISKYYLSEGANLHELQSQYNWKSDEIQASINYLERINWISCRSIQGFYIITALGALEIEKRGFIEQHFLTPILNERNELLKHFANRYISFSRLDNYTIEEFEKNYGKNYHDISIHLADFDFLGLFDRKRNRMTELGYQEYIMNSAYENIKAEYNKIKLLAPQLRGREFEKILAEIINLEKWEVKHSVKNENEENDIFISRGRENYLVEVKWLKDPVEAGQIRELIGKLTNRVGISGIFFSNSGFSSGAVVQVREQLSNVLIYLFGPEDIDKLINREVTFENLLSEKHENLIFSKNIVWR